MLARNLEHVRSGTGRIVLIEGEAGIGNTSLARAFASSLRSDDVTSAMGSCYERGLAPQFGPWHELLEQIEEDVHDQALSLPYPFGAGPAEDNAVLALQNVAESLRMLAGARPLLLVFDDLQCADMDTLELLDLATRRIERNRLSLNQFRARPSSIFHVRQPQSNGRPQVFSS